MKITIVLLVALLCNSYSFSQSSGGGIPISITYSNNGTYSIKSISYDNEFPTLRGKSIVYKNGQELYTISRSFDLNNFERFVLTISDDGMTVAYFTNQVYTDDHESKHVTIYKNGIFVKGYSEDEFIKW